MNKFIKFIITLSSFAVACTDKTATRYADALTPEESLSRFELDPNFNIEIFAAEPFVMDPVELMFDETGTAYVVEMPDYPFRPANGKGTGRIRIIRDTDDDGKIDSSWIFADSILEASSVLSWKGGVIVAAAPDIFYMKDTNGDNRGDTKELLFTGFFKNNPEYQVNNLRFSIDNWIYAANFGQAGKITSGGREDTSAISVERGDFRFRMDNGKFEVISGRAQFGHALDVWGHRFTSENSIHISQPVIPWRYVNRHPWLPRFENTPDISDHEQLMFQRTEAPYWRQERTKMRNDAYKDQKINRTEYADDHFTGACGTTLYAGDAFPHEYYGNVFVNDVAGNLVHRDIIAINRDSILFEAKRGESGKAREFLSSSDPWFRPVNLTVGPDGALYVVDMYRQHVEGPDFIPEDLKKDMNFLNGIDRGRIYRITPKNNRSQNIKSDLRNTPSTELVKLLAHSNQWWRLQAQKLILERQDKSLVNALKNLFFENDDPVTRLHALYTIDGLQSINELIVTRAMTDVHPEIREAGIMLSERFAGYFYLLKKAIRDSSARVAFQAVLSLGEFPSEQVVPLFSEVIKSRGENVWFRTAVLSSVPGSSIEFLSLLFKDGYFSDTSKQHAITFLKDFSYVIQKRNEKHEMDQLSRFLQEFELSHIVKLSSK